MDDMLLRVRSKLCRVGIVGTLILAGAAVGCAAGDSSQDQIIPPLGDAAGDTGGSAGDGGGDEHKDAPSDVAKDTSKDGDQDAEDASDEASEDASDDVSSDVDTDGEAGGDAQGDAPDDVDPDGPDACWNQLEVCDGLDNNCNGQKDESNPGGGVACLVPNKKGVCEAGTTSCEQGQLKCVQNEPASAEICDGLDNNCDGQTDNNTTDTGNACSTGLKGVCLSGTEHCVAGAPQCDQNLQAGTETCNGLDDDCNGTVDDGMLGAGQPCSVPNKQGECSVGQTNCLGGQNGCTPNQPTPLSEVCDGKDNDCNGTVDDSTAVSNLVCSTGFPGECAKGKTQCQGGTQTCIASTDPGTVPETCNAKDDDCNGSIDDVVNIKLECATKFASAQNVMDWTCTVGNCQVTGCSGANKDCDSAPANGCEVNTLNDLNHCGQCGKLCSSSHGTPSCNYGLCQIACNIGWGNCDGNPDNGCEQQLTNDVNHCGGCGQQCESTTGTPTCVNSQCQIACSAGLGNCDNNNTNGCETNTSSDPVHCGTCAKACSAVGGVASCSGGACGIACDVTNADCDNNVANGCEIILQTNVSNCGGCGNVCSTTNGAASCSGGLCSISCSAGYGNCDGIATTGCEINLNSDVANCGGCAGACSSANGTPSCLAGACKIACTAGWGDCDGNISNGCETDLSTSAGNCGACGGACSTAHGTATCSNSQCSIACSVGFGNCDNNVANGCEVDLDATPAHCSACGKACDTTSGTATCTLGVCGINCVAGFGNCDNSAANGCETNTKTSALNCSGCGVACNTTNGTASCANSVCGIACTGGYGDCDGNAGNGCETNLQTDALHCNTCAGACSTTHGTPSCAGGACSIACSTGFANCDNNAANGCEVDIDATPANCGACGQACSTVNGTASCTLGTCGIACSTGFGNCDNNAANGCETNVKTAPANCGGCGTVCDSTNGTATCANGVCGITCSVGFGNCDGNATNGCETNLGTDPLHCNTCTAACSINNGTASCAAGACQISCATNFANCDGNVANGCEVSLKNDATHCGTCANACNASGGSPSCNNGTCGIACTAPMGDCDSNLVNGCETNTSSSALNCGGCGLACSTNHATSACSGSACSITTCSAGWSNCNGLVGDGCEADLNNDPAHCGSCPKVCSANNGTPSCTSGGCGIACDTGWGNCDGNATNGCETNIKNDTANCGTCSNICSTNNGTPLCSNGGCAIICSSGYANCNLNAADGCEISTTNNASNCGSCGNACSLANATAGCSSSACVISACNAGYADCDGIAANGCEINLKTDPSHCNACPTVCNGTNGTATCSAGACGITCNPNYANCNGVASDGCEVSLKTDTQNCNTCGAACSSTNGTANCTNGICGISCTGGYANCDGLASNGCEINTSNNVSNCGSCANACSLPNAVAACSAGGCVISSCNAGYANCDGLPGNGCEVNLLADPTHCGTCATVCNSTSGTATCGSGTCGIVCNANYGNCDGQASNGCEVNLKSDAGNCNACGAACSTNNGTASCVAGACGISCNSGFGNCDGSITNGCETNTNTNASNCGGCGTVCNSTNGTPSCNGGGCQITCNAGWGNCDSSTGNGCEVNTSNNVNNCGGCGAICSTTEANVVSRTCTASACAVQTCTAGYFDQNHQFIGGCECAADAIGDSCTAATSLGTLGVGTSVTQTKNLSPTTTDEDWYVVAVTTDYSCSFRPRVVITGDPVAKVTVFTSCSAGAAGGPLACTTEGGDSSKANLTSWEFNLNQACSSQNAIDPYTGSYVTIGTTFWIRVYASASTTTCAPYTLTVYNY